MKQIYGLLLSFAIMMQLIGCDGSQIASSKIVSPPISEVSSSNVAPTPSLAPSSVPAPSVGVSSSSSEPLSSPEPSSSTTASEEASVNQMTIAVGGKTFSAALADNPTAKAFADYLPMTVNMTEMNGQEKFYGLPDNLPADSTERPSTIRNGDIFCWSGNTLVLFYNTFSNSYGGYVRLGTVEDPAGLAAAVGSKNVEVTWSLTK